MHELEHKIQKQFPEIYEIISFQKSESEIDIQRNLRKIGKSKYLVCFYDKYKFFVVWNLFLHAGSSCVNLDYSPKKLVDCSHTITYPYYKEIGHRGSKNYEKVYVVSYEDWYEFISNIDLYMMFNEYDDGYPSSNNTEETKDCSADKRKLYSSKHRQRETNFRREVLENYNNQCAICRCSVLEILQAAHLHGYEVAKTDLDADNSINGICLCANHHLMYDNEKIDINTNDLTIRILDEKVKSMPWYKEFEEKHEGKIIRLLKC